MRVTMFVYNAFRSDARVLREAAALRDAGHEVRIVAVLDATTAPHEVMDGIRIDRIDRDPPHYKLLRMSRRGRRAARLGRARLLRQRRLLSRRLARSRAWRSRPLPRRHAPAVEHVVEASQGAPAAPPRTRPVLERALLVPHKPLMFLDFYWRAYRLCRREPADVYHAHDLNTLPVAAAAARATRGRLVYDAHELYTEISTLSVRERFVWRQLERRLIGRADATMAVCESIAQELASRYQVRSPRVLLNTSDWSAGPREPEVLRRAAGIGNADGGLVLYQGGFAPNRGLEQLIAAAEQLEPATFVLMGWGRLEHDLRRLVDERELGGRIMILPPVPQHELLAYTAGADVGVIPYQAVGLNNFYATPNKLFEYMAAGLPIAASRFPELVRFVDGLEIGSTFDPSDPSDIARTIGGLLSDDNRREEMRQRALHAAERFSWAREKHELLDVYATLG